MDEVDTLVTEVCSAGVRCQVLHVSSRTNDTSLFNGKRSSRDIQHRRIVLSLVFPFHSMHGITMPYPPKPRSVLNARMHPGSSR
jgi:hypothetical protein